MSGISCTQYPHQVAQKFRKTTFPRYCDKLCEAPNWSVSVNAGALPGGAEEDAAGGAEEDAAGGTEEDAAGGTEEDAAGGTEEDAAGGAEEDADWEELADRLLLLWF